MRPALSLFTFLVCFWDARAAFSAPILDWQSIPLTGLNGEPLSPDIFRGKVVLLVNTASQCGFTPQYKDLETLWLRYRDKGLVILGVPSNDFGGQEPGTNDEVGQFCQINYGVNFPLLEKQHVSGTDAHPLYRWATTQAGALGAPRWNFHKYLIGRDGHLIDWYSSMTSPLSDKVVTAIENALKV